MSTVSYRQFPGTAAESYERYFVPTIATAVSAALLRAAHLDRGERVLDVACGTGLIARLAAEQVGAEGSVAGIDISPEMIEVAQTTPTPAGAAIDWQVGDATSRPGPDDSYDVVLCQMGLMFMADRRAAVSEMCRVLTPGGRLVVSTPGTIQPVFVSMEQAIVNHISAELGGFVRAVFSMHDPEAVATLLRDAGLADVSANVSIATLRLPPPADFLWQYVSLTPMSPFVARAPEAARTAVERQVIEESQPYVADGGILIDQPMVVATGRK